MPDPAGTSPWGEPAAAWPESASVLDHPAPTPKWDPDAMARMGWGSSPRPESRLHKTFRISRATTGIIIIALGLAFALAAGIGGLVWVISTVIHHAASN